jgi:hypothetical protein
MTVEATIFSALTGLVSARCYPDVAPELTVRPYITYQQFGGVSVNFVEQTTPSKENSKFQVNCWADTRAAAKALNKQVSAALRGTAALQTTVLGEPVATYEPDTKLRCSRQDFSFWFTS